MSRTRQKWKEPSTELLGRRFAQAASNASTTRNPATRPFSIRLSVSERQRLEAAAGPVPLGTHIRSQLLGAPVAKASRRVRPDTAVLGQILANLGRSRLSMGVADLAASARTGTIVLTPEMEAQIAVLSREVVEIRQLLMRALGPAKGGAR